MGVSERERDSKGFGLAPDPFKSAIKRYGLWPVTVWDLDYSDKVMQKLKTEIGDGCQYGAGSGNLSYQSKGYGIDSRKGGALKGHTYKQAFEEVKRRKSARSECFSKEKGNLESVYAGKITESIFNPVVAINILNLYAPKQGVCYDPFAGGGTRAIVVAKFGLDYIGVELRQEEVDAVYDRCEYNKVEVEIVCASSAAVPQIGSNSADFLITCPPYWHLEQYKGGEEDMSMAETYEKFLVMLGDSIKESYRILKEDALACWVVGLFRNKEGELLALNHDIAWLHREAGFKFKEEIVLNMKNTGAMQRVGNFDKGHGFLIRVHEYCLVFKK
uniref:Putative methyltransferase n=1 Tax=viral metagenome TaxID=1070528 RepID=A0A6M3MBV0_9ZZZZ